MDILGLLVITGIIEAGGLWMLTRESLFADNQSDKSHPAS